MTREAYKFLQSRLARIQVSRTSSKEPESIRHARTLIKDHEQVRSLREQAARELLERKRDTVREVIHAGDYDAALKAIKALEKETI